MEDIFIHTEGPAQVAYQDGNEIARMSPMGYERFLVDLFRWRREHGVCALWIVDENGGTSPAVKFEEELERVRDEQEQTR